MSLYDHTMSFMGGPSSLMCFNPILHRLFLDHDIIFQFLDNMEKNQEKCKLSFEYF